MSFNLHTLIREVDTGGFVETYELHETRGSLITVLNDLRVTK